MHGVEEMETRRWRTVTCTTKVLLPRDCSGFAYQELENTGSRLAAGI